MLHSTRVVFASLGGICITLLAYGYYLQFHEGLEPCPMCIFQRICYFGIGIFAIAGAIHNPLSIGHKVYLSLMAIFSLAGAGIAARQTWLQHLPPDKVPECGPGLDFMLEMYPVGETILKVLRGSGDCAVVDWRFLSLSIAEWSLICFIVIFCVLILHLIKRSSRLGN